MTQVLRQAGLGPIPDLPWWLLWLPPLLPAGVILLVVWFAYRTSIVRLTNRSLTIKTSFVSKTEATLSISEIESILIQKPLLDPLLLNSC